MARAEVSFKRRPLPRRAALFGAIVLGLALVGLLLGLLVHRAARSPSLPDAVPSPNAAVARVLLRVGEVDVDGPENDGVPRARGHVTTSAGQVVLGLNDGPRVLLKEQTRVRLHDLTPGDVTLRLERGSLVVRVPPSRRPRRFQVLTSTARVQVTGTQFQVTHAAMQTRVAVNRGSVRVSVPGGAERTVSAGFVVTTVEGHRLHLRPMGDEERQALARDQRTVETLVPAAVADLSLAPPTGHHPSWPDPDEPHPSQAQTGNPALDQQGWAPGAAGAQDPVRAAPRRGAAPEPRSASWLLLHARQLRQAQDWQGAEATYRQLLRHHEGSNEARSARVSLGLLLLSHRGDAQGALRLFDGYLAQNPSGLLAEEAAYGRIRALGRLGRRAEERAACAEFLRRFPRALTASLVRQRLDALEKDPVASPASGH